MKKIKLVATRESMKERVLKYKKSIESSEINEYTLSEDELSSYQTENKTDSNRSYDYLTGLEQYDPLIGFLLYRSRITTMFRTSQDLKSTEWNDLKSEAITICYELISEGFTIESETVESIAIEKDKEPHQVWINEAGKRLQNYINNQVFSSVKTSMRVLKKEALKEEQDNRKPLSKYQLHLIDTAKQLLHGNTDIYDEGMKDFMDSLTESEKKYVKYRLGTGKRYNINNRGRSNIHEKLKKAIFS